MKTILTTAVLFLGMLNLTGCFSGNLESMPTTTSAASSATADADPELVAGKKLIEMMPESPRGYNQLAAYYIKRSRETGDFEMNRMADEQVSKAIEVAPNDATSRKLRAGLHLSFHRFDKALAEANALKNEFPRDPFVYAVLSDANVEMGNYADALEAAQTMVDIRPDSSSYARVAQMRSLHGDSKGAIEMMKLAARTADPADKAAQSWCLVQLGDEHWKVGRYAEAEKIYDEALQNFPGYFLALVSKGRLRASTGDFPAAEELLNQAQASLPNANAIHLLGDIYMRRGETERAAAQYERFDAIQENLGDGADHKKLILSWANRNKLEAALGSAEEEYAAEKNIHSAQLMAWTLYRSGRAKEAAPYIREAMRLKTVDARLLFHAGMIAKANGQRSEAKRLIQKALEQNPGFDLLEAVEAKAALKQLLTLEG
jgi:tetratricopeptide (TPR) repeat protein